MEEGQGQRPHHGGHHGRGDRQKDCHKGEGRQDHPRRGHDDFGEWDFDENCPLEYLRNIDFSKTSPDEAKEDISDVVCCLSWCIGILTVVTTGLAYAFFIYFPKSIEKHILSIEHQIQNNVGQPIQQQPVYYIPQNPPAMNQVA